MLQKEKANFIAVISEGYPAIIKNYHVFGTPTMYLLDKQRKIILRPNSVKQVEAWVDWYLAQGNPLPKIE